jgi:hypothetical protein
MLRRMSSAPLIVLAGVLAVGAGACNRNKPVEPTTPAGGSEPVAADPGADGAPDPYANVEKVEVRATVEQVDDMLRAIGELSRAFDTGAPVDPLADMQAMLLAQGFAPTFFKNIDIDGLHTMWMAFPAGRNAGPEALDLAASVAVVDGRKVIEGTPQSLKPQPLGEGVWEFRKDGTQVLMREAGKELLIGLSQEDLEKSTGLRADAGKGRRFRSRAWNIPTDDIDPVDVLGLPRDNPLVEKISGVVKELEAVELEADFGTKRRLEVVGKVEAPWSKLGLEPLGKPRKQASELEKVLPPGAFFVATYSYGDPALLHKTMDQVIPLGQIPAPFSEIAKKAVSGAHTLLDQVKDDVALGFYVDAKGQAALLIAANVADAKKTTDGMREINQAIIDALEAHATIQGKNKDAKFVVDYKKDGLRFAAVKADRITVKIPKNFEEDIDDMGPFLKKNAVEVVSFAKGNTAVVAIGAGARTIAADIAKNLGKAPASSLASNEGLRSLRAGMEGCQICLSADFVRYLQFRLMLLEGKTEDKAVAKQARAHRAKLAKLSALDGAGGVRVNPKKAVFAFVVPEKTIASVGAQVQQMREINEFVESDGAESGAAAPPPAEKPESPPKKSGKNAAPKKAASKKAASKKAAKKAAEPAAE